MTSKSCRNGGNSPHHATYESGGPSGRIFGLVLCYKYGENEGHDRHEGADKVHPWFVIHARVAFEMHPEYWDHDGIKSVGVRQTQNSSTFTLTRNPTYLFNFALLNRRKETMSSFVLSLPVFILLLLQDVRP